MLLFTVHNTETAENIKVYRNSGATAPACIIGHETVCAYWETRRELFEWACDTVGITDYHDAELIDGATGEVFTYDELVEEYELEEIAWQVEITHDNSGYDMADGVTVKWYDIEDDMTYEYSGLQFRPITPDVTHVYDNNTFETVFLGAVHASNDVEFKARLIDVIR